jgi:hypothetical protein
MLVFVSISIIGFAQDWWVSENIAMTANEETVLYVTSINDTTDGIILMNNYWDLPDMLEVYVAVNDLSTIFSVGCLGGYSEVMIFSYHHHYNTLLKVLKNEANIYFYINSTWYGFSLHGSSNCITKAIH